MYEKPRNNLRRLTAFITTIIVLLPMLVGFSPARQDDSVIMHIQTGIGGWYRAGHWIPVQVFVQSDNEDITNGQLQVRVNTSPLGATQLETTYRVPFSISAGDSKRVFIYVSVSDFTRDVQVELVRPNGSVVTTARKGIAQIAASDTLYAVVSDADSLNIAQLSTGVGRPHQANWRVADIPPNVDALRALDVLLFSDTDTGQLSNDQRLAIQDWVYGGGHLIVTGGPNWQRATDGLLDLLPVTPAGTRSIADLSTLEDFLRLENKGLAQETLITEVEPHDGATALITASDLPVLVRGTLGLGTVDFLSVDPTLEPLRSWAGMPHCAS